MTWDFRNTSGFSERSRVLFLQNNYILRNFKQIQNLTAYNFSWSRIRRQISTNTAEVIFKFRRCCTLTKLNESKENF